MCRILLTHSHSRSVHNTQELSNGSWFGMAGDGKCSNEREQHGPVGVGCLYGKLHYHIGCSNRWICAVSCSRTHTRVLCIIIHWFGMAEAGKYSNWRVKHGPVGAGCKWQAPSPYRVLKTVDIRRILLMHSHSRTVHNAYSRIFKWQLIWDGWSWQMPQRACTARASRCKLPMSSSITILGAQTDGYAPYLAHALSPMHCTCVPPRNTS